MANTGSPLYRSEYEPRAFNSMPSSSDRFWPGFATGALIGTAGAVAAYMIAAAFRGGRDTRIVRFETSQQIGRPVAEVFKAWSAYERLPEIIDLVEEVHVGGRTSHWRVNIDGRVFEWQAETTQFIPNESIGWKSVSGPKNSGRVTFGPLGKDTLMHVSINYAPPLGRFGGLLSPMTEHIESYIEEALRQFKHAVETGRTVAEERGRPQPAGWRQYEQRERATGTFGSSGPAGNAEDTTEKRPGTESRRPPEARDPISNEKIARDRHSEK
jgi:uncharacterized membrane protein